ncbi:MAG: tetraacyldisaccharide 4'-kinase [Victivallales bacterium]|jgi:tetraacyldisaccharide 4'-kinase
MTLREIGEHIEQYFIEIIRERRKAPFDSFVKGLLFVASRFYLRAINTRIWLYDNRVIRYRAIGCLVVSIGNLTCGGTGKTPIVEIFARTLSQKGRRVAVLSRGYRSKDKRGFFEKLRKRLFSKKMEVPPRVVSDGKNLLHDSITAGDEPYMLASNLKDVAVLVDKDRVKSGLYAIDEFGTDVLILDDGFQYLRLKAHINIILVDSTSPFDNHHVLPRGLMREPIEHILRADYVFLTKSDGSPRLRHLKEFIRKHNHRAEIIECCHKPKYLEEVFDRGRRHPLESLQGKKIASISAIANPASFEGFLEDLGGELVLKRHYADHHRYRQQEMIDFINDAKAAGAELIVTTEKDAVRMPRLDRRDIDIQFLRVEIDILSGQENFDQCISRICFV